MKNVTATLASVSLFKMLAFVFINFPDIPKGYILNPQCLASIFYPPDITGKTFRKKKEFALYFRLSKALDFGFPKIVPTLGLPHSGPCSFKHSAFGLYPTQNASISMVFHHLMALFLFQK